MITIAQRFRPFSHCPGSRCLIPGSGYLVEAFPTQLKISNLDGDLVKEVALDVAGPLKRFTLFQDLERGCVTLSSECYRLHILPNLEVNFNKNPPLPPLSKERLALGCHKKQQWERIRERLDFNEIFPLWFRLGSLLTLSPRGGGNKGPFFLLEKCREAIMAHRPETIIPAFEKLFLAGFGHLLVPRRQDEEHHGILPFNESTADSPLYLLSEGAQLIRSLFIVQEGEEIALLPNLPPECFAGRMIDIAVPPIGKISMEWSKKTIRRLYLFAEKGGEATLHFPSFIKSYRLRQSRNDVGNVGQNGDSLVIKSGSLYLLDQFQK